MKQFEDYFSEAQANMVSVCLEYTESKVDDIYIYCSAENNMFTFNVFFKAQDKIVRKHKLDNIFPTIDTSIDRQDALLDIGQENLDLIHQICEEHNQDMPTEIKLHYNVRDNSLKANYKYELVYSNQENTAPDDIFDQWYEEIKEQAEQ